jgi:hypothetical protein
MLGVTTAVGGGLLRDVLSGEVPSVLRPGHFIMTASIVGAAIYALLHQLGVPGYIDVFIVLVVVMALRLGSEYLGWSTPEAAVAHDQMTHLGGTILSTPTRFRPPMMRPGEKSHPEGEDGMDKPGSSR